MPGEPSPFEVQPEFLFTASESVPEGWPGAASSTEVATEVFVEHVLGILKAQAEHIQRLEARLATLEQPRRPRRDPPI